MCVHSDELWTTPIAVMERETQYCSCGVCRVTAIKTVRGFLWCLEEGIKGFIFAGLLAVAIAAWGVSPADLLIDAKAEQKVNELDQIHRRIGQMSQSVDQLSRKHSRLYAGVFRTSARRTQELVDRNEDAIGFHLAGARPSAVDSALYRIEDALDALAVKLAAQRSLVERRQRWVNQSPLILPAQGSVISRFGMRYHPIEEENRLHQGVDIRLRSGTPVFATGAGKVVMADSTRGYGTQVRLRHPASGHLTLYAHLSRISKDIRNGRWVRRGELLGYSGDSGLTTGPHLHYEIRSASGNPLDPMELILPHHYSRTRSLPFHVQARADSLARQTGA